MTPEQKGRKIEETKEQKRGIAMKQDKIVIIDLGSTENAKFAREIRAMGVFTEIHPHDITTAELEIGRAHV